MESVSERIRHLIGGGCIAELIVQAPIAPDVLDQVLDAGRQAGRPLRLIGPMSRNDLPSSLAGEVWVQQRKGSQLSWLLRRSGPSPWKLAIKRGVDVLVASLVLVVGSPLLLGVGLAVRLSSPGPALYRWRVLGRYGRPVTAYKFRTMVQNADALKPELTPRNEMRGPVFQLADDPRLTNLGRWLRKHSIDELPQLWSVLKGEFSLVGPRPPLRDEYPRFELWQMRKLSITPGLTCLWQVTGRNTINDFAEWARLDLHYIDTWSLRLDAIILLRTIVAVIKGTGH